jgi:hypothetical protein
MWGARTGGDERPKARAIAAEALELYRDAGDSADGAGAALRWLREHDVP